MIIQTISIHIVIDDIYNLGTAHFQCTKTSQHTTSFLTVIQKP